MSVINVTKENYAELTAQPGPVLLDFWATWCGPCRMVAPIVEAIAEENPNLTVGKVNVDEQGELAMQYRVVSIPTLVVLKDGKVAATAVGYRPKQEILEMLGL